MKRVIKSALRVLWRGTGPIRRPILRKYESFLKRCLPPAVPPARYPIEETNALMDEVVRELIRLQGQTEYLRQAVEELSPPRSRPSVAEVTWPSENLKAV
jgi:hypothetical protein